MATEAIEAHPMRTELIKVAIVLAIGLSGWIIPAPEPMTQIGMRTFSVFISMIVGWSISNEVWPSFIGILLFPLTGVMSLDQFLATGWGSSTMFFIVLAFAMVGFMSESGLSKFLVAWLMTRKAIAGHPWRLIFMILFSAFAVCIFVNRLIGLFLMWQIVYEITKKIGQKPHDKFPTVMVFGIAMQCAISLCAVPWSGNSIANLGVFTSITGEPANYIQYLSFSIPFGIIQIAAYVALVKFVFRLDVTPLKVVKPEDIAPGGAKATPQIKIALAMLALFVAMLLTPSFIPAGTPAAELYKRFGSTGVFVLFLALISLYFYKSKRVFSFAKFAKQEVAWNMIIMVTVILAIGACMMHESTGIRPWLAQTVVPLLTSVPTWAFVFVLIIVETILTNFLVNMVVVAMLLPVIMPICPQLGLDPIVIAFTIMIASSNAILTPAGSAAASLLFPNKEWITVGEIYKYGAPTVIVNMILLVAFYFGYALIL